MRERIRINHGSLESALQKLPQWQVPQTVHSEIRRFLDDLGLGKVNRGKKVLPARQLKYLQALRAPLEFFHKSTTRLSLRDIENFERALSSGKICNQFNGRPYAHSTQVDIRMLLKIFLRWRLGPTKAATLTGWLDTRYRPKTPDFLSETEIEKLYKKCRDFQQRFLIAVLFDSGARAEEFHNIRFEDIYLPEGKESLVKIAFKQEYSKTLGRTIPLFWKFSQDAVKDYLAERMAAGIQPADPVFAGNYDATKKFLQRLGKSVLNRPLRYHLFRHSSATYYATKLNRQELCYRYGWRFSSNMPDVYISRAGMESKHLEEKFTQTELSTVKSNVAHLEQADKIKDERIRQMEESMRSLYEMVSKAMKLNPSWAEAEAALKRKTGQNKASELLR